MSAHLAFSMKAINLSKEKSASNNLRIKQLEEILKSHERVSVKYIWRIKDVRHAINTKEFRVYSGCFSLSSKYKLQLNAVIEGDYFALYLHCVESIYDPILKWPLNVDITFILMHPDGLNVAVTVQNSFENSDAEGYGVYIMSMACIEQYIIDGSLFVKCVVTVVDL